MEKSNLSIDEFRKLDLRIADVLSVEPHPNADRLWILKIKIGEEERQIVAGIRQFYQPSDLAGRKIVVVANLEPAVIRGVESRGMLLAASDPVSGQVVVLVPEKGVASGSTVK